jgi:tetratricopeptide (TPR) repeat protein
MAITTILAAALLASGVSDHHRPEWATKSVPDTVVTLVERAADSQGEARKQLLREAERHARDAVAEEDDIGRRYALAVILGLRANAEGGRAKVHAAAALSEQLDVILAADAGHAGARHMLGRLHAGIRRMGRVSRWLATNLLGGDELARATWQTAEENLAYAEEHAPQVADHHLQLALLYRDTGRPELAAEEVEHALEIEPRNALEQAVYDEALRVRSELGE